jgi:hypothetical protein
MTITSPTQTPITCADWCEQHDGHPEVRAREDQVCISVLRGTDLKLYPQMAMHDGWQPEQVSVYAERTYDQGTQICIDLPELGGAPTLRLTPDEAADIRDNLNALREDVAGHGVIVTATVGALANQFGPAEARQMVAAMAAEAARLEVSS